MCEPREEPAVIDRIVIPLDQSQLSESAIPFGILLARTLGSDIDYLQVIDKDNAAKATAAEEYLSRIVDRFPPPAGHRSVVRTGDAAEAILEASTDANAMVVMATHGYTGLRRMILGSVADAVVRHARVPIALIRNDDKFRLPQEGINRLLVPLDGSDRSTHALPIAIEIAGASQASLDLLHVIVPVSVGELGAGIEPGYIPPEVYGSMMDELETVAHEDLRAAAESCQQAGVNATMYSPVGTPADSIFHLAEETNADAIVMSTHGRGGASRVLMGSVATSIIHRSHVPVIVVPAAHVAPEADQPAS
jgi:nucleotide-binding universal stress UspA family protein